MYTIPLQNNALILPRGSKKSEQEKILRGVPRELLMDAAYEDLLEKLAEFLAPKMNCKTVRIMVSDKNFPVPDEVDMNTGQEVKEQLKEQVIVKKRPPLPQGPPKIQPMPPKQ